MKTIVINSIKGGTGKSTLAIIFVNALIRAGFRCLVIDADASNNSLSFYFVTTRHRGLSRARRYSTCSWVNQPQTASSRSTTASTSSVVM